MILGLISDTHGQRQRTATAIRLLTQVGAEAFIHCGDLGEVDSLDDFAGQRAWIALGNTDFFDERAIHYAKSLGLVLDHTPLRLELGGRHLMVFHGHEAAFTRLVNETAKNGECPEASRPCDYILHGHTHIACDIALGSVRLINPGALHRAVHYTVATLDLASGKARFWSVWDQQTPDSQPREFTPNAPHGWK